MPSACSFLCDKFEVVSWVNFIYTIDDFTGWDQPSLYCSEVTKTTNSSLGGVCGAFLFDYVKTSSRFVNTFSFLFFLYYIKQNIPWMFISLRSETIMTVPVKSSWISNASVTMYIRIRKHTNKRRVLKGFPGLPQHD